VIGLWRGGGILESGREELGFDRGGGGISSFFAPLPPSPISQAVSKRFVRGQI
jgi:hypothetical protein